ncbi:MAG: ribonuclease Y [Dehalococcoidia bacterium]
MITIVLSVGVGVLALVVGALIGYTLKVRVGRGQVEAAEQKSSRILAEAESKQRETLLEAKEEAIRLRSQAETELKTRRDEVLRLEQRVASKEESLDRKIEALEHRNEEVENKRAQLDKDKEALGELRQRQLQEIERVSGLSSEEARELLLKELDKEIREDAARRLRLIELETKENADRRSRDILATAMQRLATDVVAETTVSVVPIPSDDMKGRIIGREGRNIRALEAATGVDLIIDDTPDAVALASFDPVRREIARVALTRLVTDGRIHPTRIEEMVEKARAEVDETIREAGEEAAIEAKCPGLHPEIIKVFGRLKFRTSYGQNQLKHAIESAHIAAMIAEEVGADAVVARRGALLHDIGKAIDHDVEGTHALLGAELARRYNMGPEVVNCIESHHDEVEAESIEAIIVQIADAASGSRPGARMETLEHYIQRLHALENVANEFAGVEKAFAIQAGREIRVIVKPDQIDDVEAMRLARDVSKKIEESLEYPGQIKVTVVRETRATDYAR